MFILHYTKEETGQEYIVLLDQENKPSARDIEDNRIQGYTEQNPVECDLNAGILPVNANLHKH